MSGGDRDGAQLPYFGQGGAHEYAATTKAAIQSKLHELEQLQEDVDGLELPRAISQEHRTPSTLSVSAPKRTPSAPVPSTLQRPTSTPNLLIPGLVNKTSPSHAQPAPRVRQSPYTSPATHLLTKPINRSRSMSSIAPPVISPFSSMRTQFATSSDALYAPLPSRSASLTPQSRHPSVARAFRFGSDASIPSRTASQPDMSYQGLFTPVSPASMPLSAPAGGAAGLLANPASGSAGVGMATKAHWSPQPTAMGKPEGWPIKTVRPSQSLEHIAEMETLPENEIWEPPALDMIPDLGPLGMGMGMGGMGLATDKEISDMLDLLNMLQENTGAGGQ